MCTAHIVVPHQALPSKPHLTCFLPNRTLAPAARLADEGGDGLDENTFAPPAQHISLSNPTLLDQNIECFRELLHWKDNTKKSAFDWALELGNHNNLTLDALMCAEERYAAAPPHYTADN